MAIHCQTVAQSGGGECQNLETVNSFNCKKGGGQLQINNQNKGSNLQDVFVFTLFLIYVTIFITSNALWKNWSHFSK